MKCSAGAACFGGYPIDFICGQGWLTCKRSAENPPIVTGHCPLTGAVDSINMMAHNRLDAEFQAFLAQQFWCPIHSVEQVQVLACMPRAFLWL